MDGGVAALGPADGPRAPDVVGPGVEGVVRTLAGRGADGVDRGEVDDVEAHLGHGVEALERPLEATLGAGEELVPGAVASALAVHPQRDGLGGGQVACVGDAGDERHQGVVEGGVQADVHGGRLVADGGDRLLDPAAAPAGALGDEALEDPGSLFELGGHVLVGADLQPQLLAPGGEDVGPGLDDDLVGADVAALELAHPDVVDRLRQGGAAPLPPPGPAPADASGEQVVAVAEDAGLHRSPLPHRGLGPARAAGCRRSDLVDHDRAERGSPGGHGSSPTPPGGSIQRVGTIGAKRRPMRRRRCPCGAGRDTPFTVHRYGRRR